MKANFVLNLAIAIACTTIMTFTTSCVPTPPSVTTMSEFTVQTGGTPSTMGDPSAYTTIATGAGGADTTGCFADAGPQPLPPYPWGTSNVGSSPGVGACLFSGWHPGSYYFDFISLNCEFAGQGFEINGYFTTNSNGDLSPVNVCTIQDYQAPSAGTHFSISGSLPSNVTVGATGLISTYGMPQLLVYNNSMSLVTTVSATSVAGNGSSATFPFPTSLSQGTYLFAVKNITGSGQFKVVDVTYYSIGGKVTLTTPYAVDVAPLSVVTQNCNFGNCNSTTSYQPLPMVTLYNPAQVNWDGFTTSVGSEPVAVKAYGSGSGTQTILEGGQAETIITATGPAYAMVANLGSSTVSIVQILYQSNSNPPVAGVSVAHTISVGSEPMAIALNSARTMAYVASYGNGTLAEINLSTNRVSRTATGITGAQSVAMDPSGSYVWVGGTNNLYKVSLSTFAVVGTYAVSGAVTSLAASNAQNELVYTLVNNCCSGSSTYSANELRLSNMTSPGSYASASASPYAPYTMNGTLPSAASLPQATAVSAQFGNGMAASATPTGFVVYDVVNHHQLMAGTTPTPVRGIASDPQNQFVIFTVPDSNEYISVPLPHY